MSDSDRLDVIEARIAKLEEAIAARSIDAPRPRTMCVRIVSGISRMKTIEPGDLVMAEVPENCTIHAADATSLIRIRQIASLISHLFRSGMDLEADPSALPLALLQELAMHSEKLDG